MSDTLTLPGKSVFPRTVMPYGCGNTRDACPFLWINTGHWQPALQTFSRIRFPAQQLTMKPSNGSDNAPSSENHHRLRESILLQ